MNPTLFLLCSLAAAGCGGGGVLADEVSAQAVEPGGEAEPLRLTAASAARHGVELAPVATRALRRLLRAPAHVAFDEARTAHIGCALRGRVAEVPVSLGTNVDAGDPLLVVDSPELGEAQVEWLQRRSALQSAAPRVDYAERAWRRAKALFDESHGIAEAEVLRREAEHAAAAAALREAEVALLAARQRLLLLGMAADDVDALAAGGDVVPRLTIRAPFAGTVIARDVTLGELVSPDRDMLLAISDTSRLWVLADVPESQIGAVRPGAVVHVHRGRHGDEAAATGAVDRIAPTVDRATRTAEVRVVVEGGSSLKAGMFVEACVEVPAEGGREVVAVPVEAVQTVDRREVVFVPVAGEPHAFRMRPVELGELVDGYRPVRAGLAAGEQVVTTGSFVLKALALGSTDEGQD